MSSVNKVIIVGNLGRDPEMRTFPSGDSVANVTVATTEKWRDKQTGESKSHTEWHRVVFNGRLAEIAGQYLRKGSLVYIEGSLRTRKWTDQSGMEKSTVEIRADQMTMLGSRQDGGGGGGDMGYGGGGGGAGGGYGQPPQGGQQRSGYQQNNQNHQNNQGGYGNQGGQQGGYAAAPAQASPQQRPPAPQPQSPPPAQRAAAAPMAAPMAPPTQAGSGFDDIDDDIPF